MNKDLYGQVIYLPKEILDNLTICFQHVPNSDQNTEGHRRNEELRKNGYVTYQQLGRIKNYFDNYNGDKKDYPFILNGGDYMKTWVDQTLDSMRNGDRSQKQIDHEYKEPLYNDDINVNTLKDLGWLVDFESPSKNHYGSIDKLKVDESVIRINKLIKKII